ncbi:unnamed protein product, partial [Thelazia callipaeda]|uniref:PNPLA domain-containing protein n=1 Tax=Thelazia callipaeda TaxID=103827 RepID=A0A0N5CSE8_THECL
ANSVTEVNIKDVGVKRGLNSAFHDKWNQNCDTAECNDESKIYNHQRLKAILFHLLSSIYFSKFSGEGDLALSFSGCGFLGVYHFGVLHGLNRSGKTLMTRVKRCAGASAGSLVAALWTFRPDDTEKGFNDLIKMAKEVHELRFGVLSSSFVFDERLRKVVDLYIPDDVSMAQGRLFISLTNQKNNVNRIISEFPSRDYLIECLLASCYIPFYSGSNPPCIDGEQYIDGGFTNNLPIFEDMHTVTISPFSGSAVIAPNDHNLINPIREWRLRIGRQELKVNVQNMVRGAQALFPPDIKILKNYYDMGQRDAMKFLLELNILERQYGDAV